MDEAFNMINPLSHVNIAPRRDYYNGVLIRTADIANQFVLTARQAKSSVRTSLSELGSKPTQTIATSTLAARLLVSRATASATGITPKLMVAVPTASKYSSLT